MGEFKPISLEAFDYIISIVELLRLGYTRPKVTQKIVIFIIDNGF
jgi:hypothetical protein